MTGQSEPLAPRGHHAEHRRYREEPILVDADLWRQLLKIHWARGTRALGDTPEAPKRRNEFRALSPEVAAWRWARIQHFGLLGVEDAGPLTIGPVPAGFAIVPGPAQAGGHACHTVRTPSAVASGPALLRRARNRSAVVRRRCRTDCRRHRRSRCGSGGRSVGARPGRRRKGGPRRLLTGGTAREQKGQRCPSNSHCISS